MSAGSYYLLTSAVVLACVSLTLVGLRHASRRLRRLRAREIAAKARR